MSKTQFLVGRSELNMQDDFYPEDLPPEWRFDYYSTMFKALSLQIDSNDDLDQIFEEIEESEEEFELILSIDQEQLNNIEKLNSILKTVTDYKDNFTLYCEVEFSPSEEVMSTLSGYNLCLQSLNSLDIGLTKVSVIDQYIYFNHVPVFYSSVIWDEKKIRSCLEQISTIDTRTVLICKNAESETLNRIRIISELLGF
jgi:hypothetical protein